MAEVTHGRWTAAETRAQFGAILGLRWQIFRNGLRRKGGMGDLVANLIMVPIFLALMFGPAVGMGALGWYSVAKQHMEYLGFGLWAVFVICQFTSIQLGQPGTTFDPTQLIRFPLNFSGYATIRTFFGLISPANITATMMSLGMAIGITIADSSLALYAFIALAVYAFANIFFTRMLFSWIDRWLATRRAREIFTGLIVTFSIGIQYLNATFNPGFQHGHKAAAANAARIATIEHYYGIAKPVLNLLPPGLTANAILGGQQHHTAAFFTGVCGTLLFAVFFFSVFAMRLYKEFRGENLSDAANAVSKTSSAAKHTSPVSHAEVATVSQPGRFSPPQTVAAIFHKEVLTLRRNTGMFYGLIAPLAMVVIFAGRLATHTPASILFPAAVAYTMLGITPFSYNSLGLEAAGIQFFFLAPVRMRDVFLGKNLLCAALAAAEIAGVFAVIVYVAKAPSFAMTMSVLLWAAFTLLVSMAMGNRRSVTSPKKIDQSKAAGKQAAPLSALLGMAILLLCGGIGAGLMLLSNFLDMPWILLPATAVLATGGFFIYRAGLNAMDKLLADRRDTLSEVLCKGD